MSAARAMIALIAEGDAGSGAEDDMTEGSTTGGAINRVQMQGPGDAAPTWYIATSIAAERLGLALRSVQFACRDYWRRISQEEREVAEGTRKRVEYAPQPAELACARTASGRQWWVRESSLSVHFVNRIDPATGKRMKRGNLAGQQTTRTRRKKE